MSDCRMCECVNGCVQIISLSVTIFLFILIIETIISLAINGDCAICKITIRHQTFFTKMCFCPMLHLSMRHHAWRLTFYKLRGYN